MSRYICQILTQQLKNNSFETDERVMMLAAAELNFAQISKQAMTETDLTEYRAGDVTVKQSGLTAYDTAKERADFYKKQALQCLKDSRFAFLGVEYYG